MKTPTTRSFNLPVWLRLSVAFPLAFSCSLASGQEYSTEDDFTGDKIIIRSTMPGFKLLRSKSDSTTGNDDDIIAPAGTSLRVNKDARFDESIKDDEEKKKLFVRIKSTPCKPKKPARQGDEENAYEKGKLSGLLTFYEVKECPPAKLGGMVEVDEAYSFDRESLTKYGYNRSGWTYGVLLIPYKYHFHDKSFSAATTVGPYLGYRQGWIGVDATLAVAVGLASLPATTKDAAGNDQTSTLQGFTVAVGLITSVFKGNNPLQIGLLLGRDWAGSNAATPYEHEGRTWVAAQIGFSFTD